jgi:hypothetical protein
VFLGTSLPFKGFALFLMPFCSIVKGSQSLAHTARPTTLNKEAFVVAVASAGFGAQPQGKRAIKPLVRVRRTCSPLLCGFAQIHRHRILINILSFLNILIPILGLRKTCPEVRKNVPGGTGERARKYGSACPEVRSDNTLFHRYLWEKACPEVRSLQEL